MSVKAKYPLSILSALALAALCATETSGPGIPSQGTAKPKAPIELSGVLSGNGASRSLEVRCIPLAGGELSIELALPQGVTVQQGQPRLTRRPVQARELRTLNMGLSTPGIQRKEIHVIATLTRGTMTMTRIETVVLNEDGSTPAPKGVQRVNSRGESIMEFSAQ